MEEIQAVLEAQADAWNRGDIGGFCALYTADAVYLGRSGLVSGRDAIARQYADRYPDRSAMGTLTFEVVTEEESEDLALVLLAWSVGHARGHALVGLVRTGEGWRVRYDATA
jgi:uncharacterized protein (TIGR02246 family)